MLSEQRKQIQTKIGFPAPAWTCTLLWHSRLVRFAESVEGAGFLAVVLFQIILALLGYFCILPCRPPRVFLILDLWIYMKMMHFVTTKLGMGKTSYLFHNMGVFFVLSQLNCIATAFYFQLLVTSTPEQAYFPNIPCQILTGRHFRCDSKPNNKITEMFSPPLLTKHSSHHNFMSFPFVEIPHWQPFCSFYDLARSCSALLAVPSSNVALLVYGIL